MFLHTHCKKFLFLDLTDSYKIIATFGLSKGSVTLGAVRITSKDGRLTPKFYCSTCERGVEEKEILTRCNACGKELLVDQAYTDGKGSIFCKQDAEIYASEVKPLKVLLQRLSNG